MKRIIFLAIVAATMVSCGSSVQPMYYWGAKSNDATAYENCTYYYYKQQTPQALCNMICMFEDMVKHPGGTRKVVPPGVCAEYAYILALPESADAFAQNATAKQKQIFERSDYGIFFASYSQELFNKELQLYPESAKFIAPIIKKLKK